MLTIDASVYLNALNGSEIGSTISQELIEKVNADKLVVYSPTLLLVELAAAVARVFNDAQQGLAYAASINRLPGQVWVALDHGLALSTSRIAAQYRLRGADAVYVSVAHRQKSTLVTLDQEQLTRLDSAVSVMRPQDALTLLSA